MSASVRMARSAVVAMLAIASMPAIAAAKCHESAGVQILPGYIFIVDGQVVGEYAMDERPPHPPAQEILRIDVDCKEIDLSESGSPARQAAVSMFTRSGLPTLFTSYLSDLVDAQQTYLEEFGTHAAELAELRFFDTRAALPIDLVVTETGWSATARMEGLEAECRVAVGSAAVLDPKLVPGVPDCFAIEE